MIWNLKPVNHFLYLHILKMITQIDREIKKTLQQCRMKLYFPFCIPIQLSNKFKEFCIKVTLFF